MHVNTAFITNLSTQTISATNACFNTMTIQTNVSIVGDLRVNGTGYFVNPIVSGFSDDRLKIRQTPLVDCLASVMKWNAFKYINNLSLLPSCCTETKQYIGMSAQEIQTDYPELVSPCYWNQEYLTLDYVRLIPILVSCIQELNARLHAVEQFSDC